MIFHNLSITELGLCFTMNGRMMTILDMCSCISVRKSSSVSWKKYVILCLALPCLALPCLALPCLALPCLALPCLALPCLALPCLALSCLALPRLALPSFPYFSCSYLLSFSFSYYRSYCGLFFSVMFVICPSLYLFLCLLHMHAHIHIHFYILSYSSQRRHLH
jgi:hypothetical protein